MSKRTDALNLPTSVDDLTLVEVLKEEFDILANDFNGIISLPEGVDMPSDEEIAIAKENLLAKYNGIEYIKKRRTEYPQIKEQLDALYHDITNGTLDVDNSTFISMIKSVKDKYPKPEE